MPSTNLDTGHSNDKMEKNLMHSEWQQQVQRSLGGGVSGLSKEQQEARVATMKRIRERRSRDGVGEVIKSRSCSLW